jgi:hypothetical protein
MGDFALDSGTNLKASLNLTNTRRLDSVTSVIGLTDSFGSIGAVNDNRFAAQLKAANGDWAGVIRVEFGTIKKESESNVSNDNNASNGTNRLVLSGSYRLLEVDLWQFSLGSELSNETYERECGVKKRTIATQCADGYFSPKSFFSAILKPQVVYEVKESVFTLLSFGPKYESEEIERKPGSEKESERVDAVGWIGNISFQTKTESSWQYATELAYQLTKRSEREGLTPVNRYGSAHISLRKTL